MTTALPTCRSCPGASSVTWRVNDRFTDDYRDVVKLGQGACGAVFRTRYVGPTRGRLVKNKLVAIKVIFEENAANCAAVEIALLQSVTGDAACPDTVTCYLDHFQIPPVVCERGVKMQHLDCTRTNYMVVMDYIEGIALADWSEKWWATHSVPPPPQTIRSMLTSALEGLQYIHSRGVVHHDIKPENLQVRLPDSAEPKLTLIDFGLSCRLVQQAGSPYVTESSATSQSVSSSSVAVSDVCTLDPNTYIGTLCFQSPELILPNYAPPERQGKYATTALMASDVWALGESMLEVINNRFSPACQDHSSFARVRKHVEARGPQIANLATTELYPQDHDIAIVLKRMLVPEYSKRIRPAQALAILKRSVAARTAAPKRGAVQMSAAASSEESEEVQAQRAKKR